METYLRFTPAVNLDAPCAFIAMSTGPEEHTVRLGFSAIRDAPPRDLIVRFGSRVMASMSHEEFVHPWQAAPNKAEVPRLDGKWTGFAFPLLEVRNSQWLASFSDSEIFGWRREAARHFRFVSLGDTVDVLTSGDVTAEWVTVATASLAEPEGAATHDT
jgi:hypothetical protein